MNIGRSLNIPNGMNTVVSMQPFSRIFDVKMRDKSRVMAARQRQPFTHFFFSYWQPCRWFIRPHSIAKPFRKERYLDSEGAMYQFLWSKLKWNQQHALLLVAFLMSSIATSTAFGFRDPSPYSSDFNLISKSYASLRSVILRGQTEDSSDDDSPRLKTMLELLAPSKDCKVNRMGGTDLGMSEFTFCYVNTKYNCMII